MCIVTVIKLSPGDFLQLKPQFCNAFSWYVFAFYERYAKNIPSSGTKVFFFSLKLFNIAILVFMK